MNITLLTCLRKARIRLDESIALQRKKKPVKERFMGPLRTILLPAAIPLTLSRSAKFYLPSANHPNSKYAAVYNELVTAGISKASIAIQPTAKGFSALGILRILVRLPLVLFFWLKKFRSGSRLCWIDMYILVGQSCYRRLFYRYSQVMPIIISDVSPALYMIWSAAVTEGDRAIWWQEDYHHYKTDISFSVCASVVLNEKGFMLAQKCSSAKKIFIRDSTKVRPMRSICERPRLGVATNVFFDASEQQRALLKDIKDSLGADKLRIRLHPNSVLSAIDFHESWIEVAPNSELLKDFVDLIDICVVGNSAVQLRLLCDGVPVVHVEGLDHHAYDAYTYCAQGFVFGVQDFHDLTLDNVRSFYSGGESRGYLKRYVGVASEGKGSPLSEISSLLLTKKIYNS